MSSLERSAAIQLQAQASTEGFFLVGGTAHVAIDVGVLLVYAPRECSLDPGPALQTQAYLHTFNGLFQPPPGNFRHIEFPLIYSLQLSRP